MTRRQAIRTLTKAFRALSPEQLGNLIWHVEHSTPIACGQEASKFRRADGGG